MMAVNGRHPWFFRLLNMIYRCALNKTLQHIIIISLVRFRTFIISDERWSRADGICIGPAIWLIRWFDITFWGSFSISFIVLCIFRRCCRFIAVWEHVYLYSNVPALFISYCKRSSFFILNGSFIKASVHIMWK
jgi:hypothetical protein